MNPGLAAAVSGNGRTGCAGRGSSGTAVRRFAMQITIIGAGDIAHGIAARALTV